MLGVNDLIFHTSNIYVDNCNNDHTISHLSGNHLYTKHNFFESIRVSLVERNDRVHVIYATRKRTLLKDKPPGIHLDSFLTKYTLQVSSAIGSQGNRRWEAQR